MKQRRPVLYEDLTASFLGGSAGIAVGQPLDLIKTQLQRSSASTFSLQNLKQTTFHTKGSLWRGVGPPLIGGALYTCTTFVSYRRFLKLLDGITEKNDASFLRHFVAGTCSGWLSTLLCTPFEMAKIKLQLDDKSHGGTQGAMTRELQRLYRVGGFRAWYAGWSAMLIRDGPGSGMYFGVYHTLKHHNMQSENPMLLEFVSGGLAGVVCWLSVLPFDVAKTRMQLDSYTHDNPTKRPQALMSVIINIWRNEGARVLMSGWFPISIRAFVVNSVTFFSYERCLDVICG